MYRLRSELSAVFSSYDHDFAFFLQITICIAFSCLADFERELEVTKASDKFSVRFDFFMAVFVIGWVVVLVVFLVFLFSLTEKDLNLAVSIRVCVEIYSHHFVSVLNFAKARLKAKYG